MISDKNILIKLINNLEGERYKDIVIKLSFLVQNYYCLIVNYLCFLTKMKK